MKLAETDEERDFRARARSWLRDNVPSDKRPGTTGGEARAFDTAWQRKQYEGGWAGVSWSKEAGGLGLSLTHQLIWYEEYALAEAPHPGVMFIALNHGGPTLILRGNEEQQQKHLPKILRGEEVWCQGFSEPGAGSDLAGIQCRGVIDGDHIVVNGSKIWTSYGHTADMQELVIRTDPNAGRHGGMTWVICDMASEGITVQPIKVISGDSFLCQVFYDDVRIPIENVVGGIGNGWSVAMSTLAVERGVGMLPHQMELLTNVEKVHALALQRRGPDGVRKAIEHEDIAAKLARLRAKCASNRAMIYMSASRGMRQDAGPEVALPALHFAELTQEVTALALEILGPEYLDYADGKGWAREYLETRKYTIAGGTSEIRRNIIAERVLGMPRMKAL